MMLSLRLQHACHVRATLAYLVCVMARKKRNVICSSKMVANLLDLPIAFSFPPFGSAILEPNLLKIKYIITQNSITVNFQKTTFC